MRNEEQMWNTNEYLLQAYRLIFISSQSFMLLAGALFWGQSLLVLVMTALISICIIWGVWIPVIFARHKLVDYYKHSRALTEQQKQLLCSEAEYVSNTQLRRKANELLKIRSNFGITRIKIDIVVPISITLIWLIFVTSAYFSF